MALQALKIGRSLFWLPGRPSSWEISAADVTQQLHGRSRGFLRVEVSPQRRTAGGRFTFSILSTLNAKGSFASTLL